MGLQEIFKPEKVPSGLDVIVIGSGVGGLSAAILLAQQGKNVLVLERHYVAGGFTHTFARKGYEWDVGVHYLGEVHRPRSVLRQIFDVFSEGQLRWQAMDPVYDRICFPGESYDYEAPLEAWKQRMFQAFPQETRAIELYLDAVFSVTQATKNFFMERALPPLAQRLAGPWLRKKFLRYSDRSTLEVLKGFTSNPKLIAVLTGQYGDYGLPPSQSSFAIHAIVTQHYFSGGAYPIGGSSQIAKTLINTLEKTGGKVLVKAEVAEILLRGSQARGVRLSDGTLLEAPLVVSDAGAALTFGPLLPNPPDCILPLREQLKKIGPSASHLCLYVGLQGSAQELQLNTTNYWIYPGFDHDQNFRNFLHNPQSPFPVVYLSFPSAKDPEFAARHPGRATLEAVTFAPYDGFRAWEHTEWRKRGADYEALKQDFSERLLQTLYQWVPQVRGKIDYHELSTPLSTRHFSNYQQGEIYGLNHSPIRFRQSWLRPHTPLKNLFLTGQDIVSDGVGGALMAGVLTASAITGKNLLKNLLKSKVSV